MSNPTVPTLAESTAEALSNTVHSDTGVRHQKAGADANSTPSALANLMGLEHSFLELLARAIAGVVIGLDDGLKVGAYELQYNFAGSSKSFAGLASYTLSANSTVRRPTTTCCSYLRMQRRDGR